MSPALDAVIAYENSTQNPLSNSIRSKHNLQEYGAGTAPADVIETLSQLNNHLNNSGKHAKYDLMLKEMGMNVAFFQKLREKPSFIFSYQPGPWFTVSYQIITNLLQRLIDYFECNQEISGVFTYNNDRFTFGGLKKAFNQFYLANDLKPIHIVDKKFIEENEGLAYPYVSIEKDDSAGLKSMFELAYNLIKKSQKDYKEFERYIHTLPHEKVDKQKRIDDFIQHGMSLKNLYDLLQLIYREKILEDLKYAGDNIKDTTAWHTYWTQVNQQIMDIKIKDADTLLNQYVLAIEDIHKFAGWLAATTKTAPGEAVAVINIIDPFSHKHYSVFYDFEKAKSGDKEFLFYNKKKGGQPETEKQYLSFEEIINLAEQGLTGGPTYIPKYLLRAASHTYFLVDSGISNQNTKHDIILDQIHKDQIGIIYPWISVSQPINNDTSDVVPDNESLIALYSPFHEIEQSTAIARFFAG